VNHHGRSIALSVIIAGLALTASCSKTNREGKKAELLIKRAGVEIRTLLDVSANYRTDTGHFPADVECLYTKAQGGKGTNAYLWHRFDEDPWDKPFKFDFKTNHILISSSGPDGRWGTHDDLHEERSLK
jgi:hypothetical protein